MAAKVSSFYASTISSSTSGSSLTLPTSKLRMKERFFQSLLKFSPYDIHSSRLVSDFRLLSSNILLGRGEARTFKAGKDARTAQQSRTQDVKTSYRAKEGQPSHLTITNVQMLTKGEFDIASKWFRVFEKNSVGQAFGDNGHVDGYAQL
mmetsp:Transcript_58602/g.154958  ORF Transcript_58602/g.154958 Transcript_58602/m.154958 type:complete len:149 (-) Transcript_58602:292-738(-)